MDFVRAEQDFVVQADCFDPVQFISREHRATGIHRVAEQKELAEGIGGFPLQFVKVENPAFILQQGANGQIL